MTEIGYFCITLGLLFALLSLFVASKYRGLRKVVLALASHVPCTGLELKRKGNLRYVAIYSVLRDAVDLGLVRVSYRVNSSSTAAVRGELKTRVFRLTTEGWQAATRLRAGGGLYEAD